MARIPRPGEAIFCCSSIGTHVTGNPQTPAISALSTAKRHRPAYIVSRKQLACRSEAAWRPRGQISIYPPPQMPNLKSHQQALNRHADAGASSSVVLLQSQDCNRREPMISGTLPATGRPTEKLLEQDILPSSSLHSCAATATPITPQIPEWQACGFIPQLKSAPHRRGRHGRAGSQHGWVQHGWPWPQARGHL